MHLLKKPQESELKLIFNICSSQELFNFFESFSDIWAEATFLRFLVISSRIFTNIDYDPKSIKNMVLLKIIGFFLDLGIVIQSKSHLLKKIYSGLESSDGKLSRRKLVV